MECVCKTQQQCSQNNEGHGNCQQPVCEMALIEAGACMDWGWRVAMLTLGLFRQLLLKKAYCNVVNNYICGSVVISIVVHTNRCITWDLFGLM